MSYIYSENNIKIIDSYLISKKDFTSVLEEIKSEHPDSTVLNNRKWWHIRFEWATHNFLYKLNIERNRTKDVDINYPQSFLEKTGYLFSGPVSLIFID